MLIEFTVDYLRELYEEGSTKNKKYRFQKDIIKRYVVAIDKLKAADKIEDLFLIKSLHYEKLVGNKKGMESVRINDKYRIEFTSYVNENENSVIICSILEISKHYE
jgi:proteic killer suppression protein